jgi:hypothetical protein
MRRITVSVQAVINLPDDTPGNDYVRAVGNFLADKLGTLPSTGAGFCHEWKPGRDVEIRVDGGIVSELGAETYPIFRDAEQGALL